MSKSFIPEFTEQALKLIEEAWPPGGADYRFFSEEELFFLNRLKFRNVIDFDVRTRFLYEESDSPVGEIVEYRWWITPNGEMLMTLRETLLENKRDQ